MNWTQQDLDAYQSRMARIKRAAADPDRIEAEMIADKNASANALPKAKNASGENEKE